MHSPAVRRASDRPLTRRAGILTRHTFSFGAHYDPEFTGVGPLVALNEERMAPGAGYDEHRHVGVDVVSWVAAGEVAHVDEGSGSRVVPAGSVAVLRSATGVAHVERCAEGAAEPAVLLQSWLVSARAGAPSYAVASATGLLGAGRGFACVAAGPGRAAAPTALSVPGAALWVARAHPGEGVALPPTPVGWMHVVSGGVALALPGGGTLELSGGDGVELRDVAPGEPGRPRVVARGPGPAEVLVWDLPPPA